MNSNIMDFVSYKDKLERFVIKEAETFYFRFLMEGIIDETFMHEVINIIDYVHSGISAVQINDLFVLLREKSIREHEKAVQETDPEKRIDHYLKCLAYFCLVEALNENSSFSTEIEQQIFTEYGSDTLTVLSCFDRANLSVDGKIFFEEAPKDVDMNETLRKYLVMKEWQDKQREYSLVNIRTIYPIEEEYVGAQIDNLMRLHKAALVKRAKIKLDKSEIIPIDIISKYCIAGVGEEFIELIGGKAYGLAVLNANSINIPKTYIIPVGKSLTADISEIFHTQNTNYAVRSSATAEDGASHSFAGVFDSFLDVPPEDVPLKVEAVRKSCMGDRAKSYTDSLGVDLPEMAVILQTYVSPDCSGVWMGLDRNRGYLEWVDGNGAALVSGRITPNREEWSADSERTGISDRDGKPIGQALLEMQRSIHTCDQGESMADFEWCVIDGRVVMLQYRPVTKAIGEDIKKHIDDADGGDRTEYFGIPVSPGIAEGKAKFVGRLAKLDVWCEGDILMAWFTDPDWYDIMSKSSGLVTAVGGLLCHASIISRELGIPCVTGLGQDMKKIWGEKYIYLDGNTGVVRVKKANNNKSSAEY